MNFLFDNNLSPAWARALAELSKTAFPHLVNQVIPLREKFPPNTPDIDWLTALKQEGNWTVISSDAFRKSQAEKELVRRSGLNVFVLPSSWHKKHNYWLQTIRLIECWPQLVETACAMRSVYVEIPWKRSDKLRQIRV